MNITEESKDLARDIPDEDDSADVTKKPLVTCNQCGYVMFAVTLEYARREVSDFNKFFWGLEEQKRNDYYGGKPSSLKNYCKCINCGGTFKNFRPAIAGDCPDGCTINPVLHYTEVYE